MVRHQELSRPYKPLCLFAERKNRPQGQTKILTLARVVLAQLLPDDRKIEWARSLAEAEDLLVGAPERPAVSSATVETDTDRLDRARSVFQEMQRQYATGNFARYGELLQQLEKLLGSP